MSLQFDVIFIGSSGTGKTSTVNALAYNEYINSYCPISTVGIDICTINVTDKNFIIRLCDTAGQERFASMTSQYYKHAHLAILCFSLVNYESMKSIVKYLDDVYEYSSPDTKVIIVGTFNDNVSIDDSLNMDEYINKVIKNNENKIVDYIKISNLNGNNTNILLDKIINILDNNKPQVITDKIDILTPNTNIKKKKFCCF